MICQCVETRARATLVSRARRLERVVGWDSLVTCVN